MKTDPEKSDFSRRDDDTSLQKIPDRLSDQAIIAILNRIRTARFSSGITCWQHLPPRPGSRMDLPGDLHPEIADMLKRKGISRLYSHQEQSWRAVRQGENPVIVTPTASGKTLCYNLPVLDRLLTAPESRALYVFPAKALAQDQYQELIDLTGDRDSAIRPGVYDGDTSGDIRKKIRDTSRIVLTNPDMIHSGILPHHIRWASFLRNLEFVVIDEMHQYRGIFGSHLCNVLRRFRRVCRFHGANPRFILSSATIANPVELAERLTGEPVRLIDESGAPAGEKDVLFYNPPVVDFTEMIRRSYLDETIRFTAIILEHGVQTIVFARSRRNVELLLVELKKAMRGKLQPESIQGYRGGYLPKERREIESGLRTGRVRCVIATSALELGIDIGNMGAAVLAGYPGTIASTWQRAGRAGRRETRSLVVVIASAAPLDQYMVRNPDYFFSRPAEHGLINPDNLMVLLEHIRCAAFELPFTDSERFADLAETNEFLEYLEAEGEMKHSGGRWFFTGGDYPAERVSLRSISAESVAIQNVQDGRSEIIGELDVCAAHLSLHPEAIYLHAGRQFLVRELDLQNLRALIQPADTGYFTTPIELMNVEVLEEKLRAGRLQSLHLGEVKVTSQVTGFRKLRMGTQELMGTGSVRLPVQELITVATWITLPMDRPGAPVAIDINSMIAGFAGALAAIQNIATVMLMSDARDLGSCIAADNNEWTVQTDHLGMIQLSGRPPSIGQAVNLFVFDRYPGGIGLSENLFRIAGSVVAAAVQSVRNCECRHGCPGCIGPVNNAASSAKSEAIETLEEILEICS